MQANDIKPTERDVSEASKDHLSFGTQRAYLAGLLAERKRAMKLVDALIQACSCNNRLKECRYCKVHAEWRKETGHE